MSYLLLNGGWWHSSFLLVYIWMGPGMCSVYWAHCTVACGVKQDWMAITPRVISYHTTKRRESSATRQSWYFFIHITRICKPFEEPSSRFPACRASTTTLFSAQIVSGTNCIGTNCIGTICIGTICIRHKLYRAQTVSGTNCNNKVPNNEILK